jgi:competence protein ComEC
MSLWVLAGFVLGILGSELFNSLILGWVCFGLGLFLLLLKRGQKIALFVLFLGAGMLLTFFRLERLYLPDYGSENSYIVRSTRLVQEGDDYFAWQGKVLEPKNLAGAVVLIYSDQYRPGVYSLLGPLYPPVQYRNPGQGWHYKRRLYAGEIGILNRPQIRSFQELPLSLIEKARSSYRNNIAANIANADSAALALALTTGDRSLLQGELKSSVYMTGVGHVMAMSGLHVGILLGLSLTLMRRLGLSRVFSGLAGFACIIIFVIFAGPSPSLVRAVLMSAWGIAALIWGREKQGMQALQWTGFFMLLYNPLWLFDYAFVFSFAATFVCLATRGRLDKLLAFLPELIRRTGSITIIIQLVALPLTICLFGSSSLWSPLANIVIIPLMPVLTGFSLLAGLIPGALGIIISLPAMYLLGGVAEFLSLLNQFPLPIEFGGLALTLSAVISGGLLLHLSGLAVRKTAYLTVAGLLVTVLIYTFMAYGVTTVWFLDVGQGDSILIRSRGQWVLVDCGDYFAGEKAVLPTLRFLGVDKLKALILTHPHADHVGGMEPVLANIPVEQVLSSFMSESVAATVITQEAKVLADLEVFSHNLIVSNPNDASLLVSLGGNKLLLTGDIEEEGERLYWHRIVPHQVLKVPHHGSNTSSSPEFLLKVQPQAAVISCGLGNRFGLPGKVTLENLAQVRSQVYRTDLSGFVRIDFWPWGTFSIITFLGR